MTVYNSSHRRLQFPDSSIFLSITISRTKFETRNLPTWSLFPLSFYAWQNTEHLNIESLESNDLLAQPQTPKTPLKAQVQVLTLKHRRNLPRGRDYQPSQRARARLSQQQTGQNTFMVSVSSVRTSFARKLKSFPPSLAIQGQTQGLQES